MGIFGRLAPLAAMLATLGATPPGTAAPVLAPVLAIVGYNDMDEMLGALTRAYSARHPDVRFTLQLKSTRSAPPALLDGSADLAPMGAAMEPADQAAIAARWGATPLAVPIAHDSLTRGTLSSPTGVFVHRDNPLRAISFRQLRRIFGTGAAPVPWRALGVSREGTARPIGLAPKTAIGLFVQERVGIDGYAAGYRGFGQSRDAAAAIGADPDAIGFANLNHAAPGIRALDLIDDRGRRSRPDAAAIVGARYPLDRQLLIYVRRTRDGRVAPAVAGFLAFVLSPEGQRIVASGAKGYLPLSVRERARALAMVVKGPSQALSAPVRHLADRP